MKKLFLSMIFLSIGILIFPQPVKGKLMPLTTNSKSALAFYNKAMKYYDDVNLNEAMKNFKQALNQDPNFFMVNYQLAFYFLLNRDADNFNKFADAAVNCKANLSDAENLLKEALVRVQKGSTNVVELGKRLVELYPGDPNSYNNLVSFQSLAGDTVGIVETLKKAIEVSPNQASFYNQLGYAYLTLKQNDKAEEAFDKYIDLDPKNPNVYDSKGDYYMFIKKYDRAYESYMKAYSIDPAFSHDKAEMAKRLYEQTEGKKLEIISI
jgi:tetratricopeptide (TPR) repeat protein